MELLGYLSSILMGLSLGMIGGGGSILTVPILVYLFKVEPLQATAYSLFIVGLTALFGSFTNIKSKTIDFKVAAMFGFPSLLGVSLTRSFIVPAIPTEIVHVGAFLLTKDLLIMGVFAILMVMASFSMIKSNKPSTGSKKAVPPHIRYLIIAAEGLIVGGITGLVGAGGGFLIIPALVFLAGLPMRMAVGTSLLIIAVKSLGGFLSDPSKSDLNWNLLLTISAIAVVGIFVGSYLSKFVSEAKLKKAFGYFVLIMGSFVLIDQVMQLKG